MEMHRVALVQEKKWDQEVQVAFDCHRCGHLGRKMAQPSANKVSNKIEAIRAHADISSVAIENLRTQNAASHSPETIIAAYLKAYEEWWQARPPKFRTWGMFSNDKAGIYGQFEKFPKIFHGHSSDIPMCMNYADAAATYMNSQVNIPNTAAYSVGNHEKPGDKFGHFVKTQSSGSHYNVHVYMADQQGRPVEVLWVDPWWRIR
jgi:hypothetical protein